jgi:hypothetical protein
MEEEEFGPGGQLKQVLATTIEKEE